MMPARMIRTTRSKWISETVNVYKLLLAELRSPCSLIALPSRSRHRRVSLSIYNRHTAYTTYMLRGRLGSDRCVPPPCLPSSPLAPATMAPKAAPPSPAPTELDTDTTLADTQSEGSVSQGGSGSRSRSPPALVAAPRAAVGGEEQGQEAAPPVQADLLAEEDSFGFLSWVHEEAALNRRALRRESPPEPRSTRSGLRQPLFGLREAGPPARHTGSGSRSSASGSAGLRWSDMPLTNDHGVVASVAAPGMPLAQELHALLMQAPRADQRVDRSRFRRCDGDNVDTDLGLVRIAVSSLCPQDGAFYIGGCAREPEDRFYNVGSDRAGPGQSAKHCVRFDHKCVLYVGTGAQIADRETAAIRLYSGPGAPLRDARIRNVTDVASGYSRDRRTAYLYLCYRSAERADSARLGGFMS